MLRHLNVATAQIYIHLAPAPHPAPEPRSAIVLEAPRTGKARLGVWTGQAPTLTAPRRQEERWCLFWGLCFPTAKTHRRQCCA